MRHSVQRTTRAVGVVVALVGFFPAQVGFPMTVSGGNAVRPCGCPVAGESSPCCCGPEKKHTAASCCQPKETPSCCRPKSERQDQPTPTAAKSAPRLTWVMGSALQHCRGAQTSWISNGAVLPPSHHVALPVRLLNIESVRLTDSIAFPLPVVPNDPPPRVPSL